MRVQDSDRIAEYDMKLMDIDSDTLGIPETDYDASVTMSSAEFTRIVRDLSLLGESVRIDVSKEGIRFASDGEAANGNVLLKQTAAAREKYKDRRASQDNEVEDEEQGSTSKAKKDKVKKESDDVEMNGGEEEEDEEFKAKSDDEEEEEEDMDSKKKRKKAPSTVSLVVSAITISDCSVSYRVLNRRREPRREKRQLPTGGSASSSTRPLISRSVSNTSSTFPKALLFPTPSSFA
jgi:hypothetical protein